MSNFADGRQMEDMECRLSSDDRHRVLRTLRAARDDLSAKGFDQTRRTTQLLTECDQFLSEEKPLGALDTLEAVVVEQSPSAKFWRCLWRAAARMGLTDRAAGLRRAMQEALVPGTLEAEVFDLLDGIEDGRISVTFDGQPQAVFAGEAWYKASNGAILSVFIDINEWDYIELIVLPGGRRIDYFELEFLCGGYSVSDYVAWVRYGIPGYGKYRCTECGREIRPSQERVFLCKDEVLSNIVDGPAFRRRPSRVFLRR